jgi:hypothetical protein
MTEEEIEHLVEHCYLEFTDYMKKVEGFATVPEMINLKYWELWKQRKYHQELQKEIHGS